MQETTATLLLGGPLLREGLTFCEAGRRAITVASGAFPLQHDDSEKGNAQKHFATGRLQALASTLATLLRLTREGPPLAPKLQISHNLIRVCLLPRVDHLLRRSGAVQVQNIAAHTDNLIRDFRGLALDSALTPE